MAISLFLLEMAGLSRARTITVGSQAAYDFDTIQAGINAASNGDTVLVDRGVYHENLTINGKIITLASNYINSNDEDDILQTVVDGGGTGQGSILKIQNVTTGTVVTGLTFQNGSDGILPYSKFTLLHCRITGCDDGIDYESSSGGICMHNVFEHNNDDGIDLDQDVDIEIANNIIRYNKDDGIEIRLHPYTGSTLTYNIHDNTITRNGEDGIQLIDYDGLSDRVFYIENNIIAESTQVGVGCMDKGETNEDYRAASISEPVYIINNTFYNSPYGITGGDNMVVKNNMFAEINLVALKEVDGSSSITYNAFWHNGTDFSNTSPGVGNYLNINPLFTDATHGDYHLQSQAGRWEPNSQSWVRDAVTSPCIDAGDPNSNWTAELWPHGKRINMGAYGGTPQASMSLSVVGNIADLDHNDVVDANDLAVLAGTWLAQGVLLTQDLNHDAVVHFRDFAKLAASWRTHVGPEREPFEISLGSRAKWPQQYEGYDPNLPGYHIVGDIASVTIRARIDNLPDMFVLAIRTSPGMPPMLENFTFAAPCMMVTGEPFKGAELDYFTRENSSMQWQGPWKVQTSTYFTFDVVGDEVRVALLPAAIELLKVECKISWIDWYR